MCDGKEGPIYVYSLFFVNMLRDQLTVQPGKKSSEFCLDLHSLITRIYLIITKICPE